MTMNNITLLDYGQAVGEHGIIFGWKSGDDIRADRDFRTLCFQPLDQINRLLLLWRRFIRFRIILSPDWSDKWM